IDLSYAASKPPAPALAAPANAATDVALHPLLSWQAATAAATYVVQVATDPAFTHIVASAETTDTSYTVDPALNSGTQYFWRVTARNGCGDSSSSVDRVFGNGFDGATSAPPATTVFTFTTAPQLGDCEPGTTPQVLFSEGVESGAPGWGLGGDLNGLRWMIG